MNDEPRHAAFRDHVLPELDVMLRVARRLTRDPNEAEDLVQDALVRAYRALDRFDGRYPRAWLLTILRNTHYNRLRKRRPDLLDDEAAQRLPATGADGREDGTPERALHNDFDPRVRAALTSLSAKHRAVVALVDLDGLTYQEASGRVATSRPRSRVRSRATTDPGTLGRVRDITRPAPW